MSLTILLIAAFFQALTWLIAKRMRRAPFQRREAERMREIRKARRRAARAAPGT